VSFGGLWEEAASKLTAWTNGPDGRFQACGGFSLRTLTQTRSQGHEAHQTEVCRSLLVPRLHNQGRASPFPNPPCMDGSSTTSSLFDSIIQKFDHHHGSEAHLAYAHFSINQCPRCKMQSEIGHPADQKGQVCERDAVALGDLRTPIRS
jgi:hypothetical protein